MRRLIRMLAGATVAVTVPVVLGGCSTRQDPEMHTTSTTGSAAAKDVWDRMNRSVEATQSIVGGDWSAWDTAARPCGENGAQWVVSRIGRGTDPARRAELLHAIEQQWLTIGWRPVESDITGDAPGKQLRFPGASALPGGFFVEFGTTVHASTVALQTPCAPGDVVDLNTEQYAERHTNTPPGIPGAGATPSPSPDA